MPTTDSLLKYRPVPYVSTERGGIFTYYLLNGLLKESVFAHLSAYTYFTVSCFCRLWEYSRNALYMPCKRQNNHGSRSFLPLPVRKHRFSAVPLPQ